MRGAFVVGCAAAVACGAPDPQAPGARPGARADARADALPGALPDALPRVVSVSPAGTAFVVDLGAGATLVAVDRESAGLGAEVASIPVVRLVDVPPLRPDVVLTPPLASAGSGAGEAVARLRAAGTDVVEIAPRDYDGVFALCRTLGARLAGVARAAAYESELGRELASLAAESRFERRPRVVALASVDPLEVAPAHGFATDLVELAGGTSAAHDHGAPLTASTPAELGAAAPDVVLVLSGSPMPAPAREAARRALGPGLPVEFFAVDTERFWVRDGADTVRRLRAVLDRYRDEDGFAPR